MISIDTSVIDGNGGFKKKVGEYLNLINAYRGLYCERMLEDTSGRIQLNAHEVFFVSYILGNRTIEIDLTLADLIECFKYFETNKENSNYIFVVGHLI